MTAVILEPKKIKSVTASTLLPYMCHAVMGPDAMLLLLLLSRFSRVRLCATP